MAFPVAKELSVDLDEVIWNMPAPRLFKILGMIQRNYAEKPGMSRHDRKVTVKLAEELSEKINEQRTES